VGLEFFVQGFKVQATEKGDGKRVRKGDILLGGNGALLTSWTKSDALTSNDDKSLYVDLSQSTESPTSYYLYAP